MIGEKSIKIEELKEKISDLLNQIDYDVEIHISTEKKEMVFILPSKINK